MMIKAIIFDLDGTIVDTELHWSEAMHNYLTDQGCNCTRQGILEIVFGRSWSDIYNDINSGFPTIANISSHEMALRLSEYHRKLCSKNDDIVIESSVILLKELAELYPVIVVSGSPRHDVIENLQLAGVKETVRFILGAEDYAPGKPDPAGFLKGARMLGVEPDRCLVFEDSQAGVTAAKAAGMHCVALARENAHKQNVDHADLIVTDLAGFDINTFTAAFNVWDGNAGGCF